MARLLSGIQNLWRRPPRPDPDGRPAPAAEGVTLRLDRFRAHPQLVEVWADAAPPARRIRFTTEPDGVTVAEMPRGLTRFLFRLPDGYGGAAGVGWHEFGSPARRVTFVAGDPLQPRVPAGTRLRLQWDPPAGLPLLRVVPLRWADPLSPLVAPPEVVPAGPAGWEVPAHWLTTDPLELRLTPVGDGGQGLTECLLLPGRRPQVETVFRRLMLTPPERSAPRRRLQVEVRAPEALTPAAVLVEWQPRDREVTAEELIRVEWPTGGAAVAVNLPNVSMRGDRVRVRFEPPAAATQAFAWYHADETGYGTPVADAVLAEGVGAAADAFEYTHGVYPPSGEPVRLLLSDPEPPEADGWPASVVALAGQLGVEVDEFVLRPQVHALYAHEPLLRAVRRRLGEPGRCTVVGHLAHAAAGCTADQLARLEAFAAGCGDTDLDRWLEAAAAGAAVDRLLPFWTDPKWADLSAWQVVEAAAQLDEVRAEPLSALLPELLPMGPLADDLRRAVEQEGRLPSADPAEFARAAVVRRWVLGALADHWGQLLPADADELARAVADRLRSAPATAAGDLTALRAAGTLRLRPSRGPLFLIERPPGTGGEGRQYDRRLRRRAAADWYRTLVRSRMLPAWPWCGLLPADQTTAGVRAEWEAVRDTLPPAADPPPAAVADRLAQVRAVVAELEDDDLRGVADETLSHAPALAEWLR